MKSWTITEAFDAFESISQNAGLKITSERHPECFGNHVSTASDGTRLVWDGNEEWLKLEIPHGPLKHPRLFWLDLYSASCPDGVLQEPDNADVGFISAIEYGLSLGGPPLPKPWWKFW